MNPYVISLLSIDVGFDVRVQQLPVSIPKGVDSFEVIVPKGNGAMSLKGDRTNVVRRLRLLGYKVAK